jgi:trehalose 6-phosphate phosphatase
MSIDRIAGVVPNDLLVITDFDGTLAPIVPFPAHARAVPGALASLETLSTIVGQVVILTGRSRPSLMVALDEVAPKGVRILCNYGADDPERPMPYQLDVIATLLDRIVGLHGRLPEGVMIEEKGSSIALHTRGCSEPASALSQISIVMGPVAHELGLDLQQGRDVIDIGIRFGGKAATVRRILEERNWSGAIMFGDDHSDLEAFDVLADADLPTLTVGVISQEVPGVQARSDMVVAKPEQVAAILSDLVKAFTPVESNAPRSK